jgi:hypothetical protein
MVEKEIEDCAIILEEDTSQRLFFQMMPDNVLESRKANWVDIPIIGRSEPIRAYANSEARKFNLTLMFAVSVDQADGGEMIRLRNKIDFLRSLVLPDQVNNILIPPPTVFFVLGNQLYSRCIVNSVDIVHKDPWLPRLEDFQPQNNTALSNDSGAGSGRQYVQNTVDGSMYYEVKLQLEEVNLQPQYGAGLRRLKFRNRKTTTKRQTPPVNGGFEDNLPL